MFKGYSETYGVYEIATFGAGCFWCVEAIFKQIQGVINVTPGYAGGTSPNPTYTDVANGTSGHIEVCQINFDSKIVSFDELLEVFWLIHDPTSIDRQGDDVGRQFRSVIFYHNQQQKESANEYIKIMDDSSLYIKPIVTSIIKYSHFFRAEDYHQDYFEHHNHQPYCLLVIKPKIEKFRIVFSDKLKTLKSTN